jgi:outer membrane protein assembly factor BamB
MSNRYFTTDSYPYQLAAADFDGDGQSELALSVETPYSTSPGHVPKRFQIVDPADGEEQFQIPVTSKGPYIVGGYLPTAAGVDTIIGSTDGGDYKGPIARVDAISGEIRWQTEVPDGATDLRNVSYLTVANVSGFSGPVIVAAGRAYQTAEAEILALSADDGSVLWHVGESDGSLPYTNVLSISAIDRDRDSIDESLLVCAGEHQLRQFDARNGNLLWESGAVDDGDCIGTLQLEIAGRVQLVALMSPASIVAFDAETHEESWRLEPDIEFDGAAYLPHGENGPELAVYDWQGKLQFFNLETRALLREYQSEDLFYMQGLAQPADGLIQDLIVPLKGAIAIVDGLTGLVRARSEQFGYGPSNRSPIKLYEDADRSTLIGIGTYVATFTHRLIGVGDSVFVGNFD